MNGDKLWGGCLVATAIVALSGGCEPRSTPPAESATSVANTSAHESTNVGVTAGGSVPDTNHSGIRPTLTPAARMDFHSREAEAMRLALTSGDRKNALVQANKLAEDNWTPHLRPSWKEHMSPMYAAARAYVEATDAHAAAVAVGNLGLACASCHRVLGGPNPESSGGGAPEPSMQAHAWSVERLWFGLMAPSDSAWGEGAIQLSKSPIVGSDIALIDAEAQRLQSFGRLAIGAKGDQRASVFGDIMNTCATCHRRVGREP